MRSQTETAKRYRYSGKEKDEENKFIYFGTRYYTSWIGRWVTADQQLWLAEGVNLYDYAKNNPIVYLDPDGAQPMPSLPTPTPSPPPPNVPPPSPYPETPPPPTWSPPPPSFQPRTPSPTGFKPGLWSRLVAFATPVVAASAVGITVFLWPSDIAPEPRVPRPDAPRPRPIPHPGPEPSPVPRPGPDPVRPLGPDIDVAPRRPDDDDRRRRQRPRILFGQRRIGRFFGSQRDTPEYLRGRSIYEVAARLRRGSLRTEQIRVDVFPNPINPNELIELNNRGLAALSLAGRRPTNVRLRIPTPQELRRLAERPLVSARLPAPVTAVTRTQRDLRIRDIIRVAD